MIGSPIGPYKGASYWSEEGEAAREKINDWIVHGGAFDGVIRLDTAFADPTDPQTDARRLPLRRPPARQRRGV